MVYGNVNEKVKAVYAFFPTIIHSNWLFWDFFLFFLCFAILKIAPTCISIKVTVNVGTDQIIEIEIFAEYYYKYILNELPVIFLFSIRLIVCEIWKREFLPEVNREPSDVLLGANFSKHVLAKTTTMQRINTPSIFNFMPSNLTS